MRGRAAATPEANRQDDSRVTCYAECRTLGTGVRVRRFDMVTVLENKLEAIVVLCRRYRVARLHVFGSALREDFRPGESDVDLLVEFGPMDPFALVDAYFGLLNELRGLLDTKVDLVMSDAIKNRYVAAEVERTKQVLYAA